MRPTGRVEAIGIANEAMGEIELVDSATARAGRGLDGDRYSTGRGTFSSLPGDGRHLTLIESEALEALEPSVAITFDEARRNILTSGVDLNAMVGLRFFVGEVECVGRRLCEPCDHLQRVTKPGVLKALVHSGGLRADILTDGVISVGDEVRQAGA